MRLGVRGVVCNLGVFDSKCLRINGFRWCALAGSIYGARG